MSKLPALRLVRKAPANVGLIGRYITADEIKAQKRDLVYSELAARSFKGNAGDIAITTEGDQTVCLIGVTCCNDGPDVRKIGISFARTVSKVASVAIEVGDFDAGQLAEGILLGAYSYSEQKSDPAKPVLNKVALIGSAGKAAKESVRRAEIVAKATCLARDLVNEPGGSLLPAKFANIAKRLATNVTGFTVKVWGMPEIKKAKLGGLLGVNQGSDNPARLVEMTYKTKKKDAPTVALVGKGLTFDSGGLSIKPTAGMVTMKADMGGGAAVVGAMSAIAALAPEVNVKAWVPMTDNMLGGNAVRVGDVLKMRNGKTVEVLNTDAEGRLILADALSLASEAKPDAIIDLATLTGAAVVSLGNDMAAMMSNSDELAESVKKAAASAGEMLWALPLEKRYRRHLDSKVADLKNVGIRWGGSIQAALFLEEFVADGIDWVHLDIAGPAYADAPNDIFPAGGTGYGVATLVKLVEDFKATKTKKAKK